MTDKITTTLKQIRKAIKFWFHLSSDEGYDTLRKFLGEDYGDDTPITFRQIYESNGYDDTLWCLRTVDHKWFPLWRHFAVDCAEDVKHLMTDERSLNALVVARKHAEGNATDEELDAAGGVSWMSAWEDAWDTARSVARDIAGHIGGDDPWSPAWKSALYTAQDAQMNHLFEYCRTGERVKMKKGS